ncbi:MAG: S8 family serine peptidase [Candidatus Aminicenantes bacterium]|nr:S8 family serine peptidase [Candidatus Aminicenantes bacterium]
MRMTRSRRRPLRWRVFVLILGFCAVNAPVAAQTRRPLLGFGRSPAGEKVAPLLRERLRRLGAEEVLPVWIFFRDKGFQTVGEREFRTSELLATLGERCLGRRAKARGAFGALVDEADLPLHAPYLQEVRGITKRVRVESRWLNAVSVEVNAIQAEALAALDFVTAVEPVGAWRRSDPAAANGFAGGADAPVASLQIEYGRSFAQLDQIGVLPLHKLGYSGRGVLVGLLDTGFRKSHEVFRLARLIAEHDFVFGDDDVAQDNGNSDDYSDSHGTATWSLAGGYQPGQLIGPAYGADFLLAKTEIATDEKPIEEDYWVAGIEWAEGLGVDVVSSSLGYIEWYEFQDLDGKTAVTTRAANRAVSLGVVVVNAVGNERGGTWNHIIAPADAFEVVSVGAVTSAGSLASFSSPGPSADGRTKPEVCALGVGDWIASNQSDGRDAYSTGSGTSFSTPLVAGTAALILEVHRNWTPQQVRNALLATASRSASPDNDFGWGIVNAAQAAHLPIALPRLVAMRLDDSGAGRSSGNGNGRAEPGETMEIYITLRNDGEASSSSLVATLTSAQPGFRVLAGRITVPAIPPGGTRAASDAFAVRVPDDTLVGRAVFWLTVEGALSARLDESLVIPVAR